ncbi:energy-coupled thiamine transporter ThiT [Vagococcus sp. JNUCC 83]
MSKRSRIILEGTIVAALSMALSFIPLNIGTGFSVSLGMIPLTLYALRRGTIPGVYAGLIWGLLHFLMGQVYFLMVSQVIIEYIFAFAAAGVSGVFSKKLQFTLKNNPSVAWKYVVSGTFFGVFVRYTFHFIAGFIFWGQYAVWGLSPVTYSLVANGISGFLTGLATVSVLLLVLNKNKGLFIPKDY